MAAPATEAQLRSLPPAALQRIAQQLTPRLPHEFVPHSPTHKQAAALALNAHRELLYGGSAGGGKSDYLLMAALQFVNVPGYSALLLRRTFAELAKADGLIARAQEWLAPSPAKWNGNDMKWTFPSGATLEFGHLQRELDRHNYQSAAYQFIGFDELTSFTASQYTYLFSRCRRPAQMRSAVPLRVRGASNPGGIGHEWVKERFELPDGTPERPFVPAKLSDNRHLDQAEYRKMLAELDPITRAQLERGDWTTRHPGALFKREWFEIVDELPKDPIKWVRHWDLAATPKSAANPDPDWTAGVRMGKTAGGVYYVSDVRRWRKSPGERDDAIVRTAAEDGRTVQVSFEQEPGSAGKSQVAYLVKLLDGYVVTGDRATGDKATRARPAAAQAEHGNVKLLSGPWVGPFLDEVEAFDGSDIGHDDQVDGFSGAHEALAAMKREGVAFKF